MRATATPWKPAGDGVTGRTVGLLQCRVFEEAAGAGWALTVRCDLRKLNYYYYQSGLGSRRAARRIASQHADAIDQVLQQKLQQQQKWKTA